MFKKKKSFKQYKNLKYASDFKITLKVSVILFEA